MGYRQNLLAWVVGQVVVANPLEGLNLHTSSHNEVRPHPLHLKYNSGPPMATGVTFFGKHCLTDSP